ncbi:MAG TPA: S-layer homology domain-containing protein [Symbiobacteriaceae bacterium]|nr:S-layer homology domain-containing protein [Symbiobacteriaceae bacterium]
MRRLLGLLLAFALLCSALPASAYSYYPPGPSGPIGLSLPTLGQQIELRTGELISGAKAWIDERPVKATWTEEGSIRFHPDAPLAPGEHTARLQVMVDTGIAGLVYLPHETTWRFTVQAGALITLPTAGPEVQRAQARLNQIRRSLALPLVTISDDLSAAARSHAAYLLQNPSQYESNAHAEVAGRPGFTGASGSERAAYWGWLGASAEVIAPGGRAEDAIDGWLATLYHRLPLIQPGTRSVGYGWAGAAQEGYNVLVAGPTEGESDLVAWPFDGMKEVPPEWDGLETPDPLTRFGVSGPVGYPITLTWGGPISGLRLTEASLVGPEGEVPILRYDPFIDEDLTDTVAVIPRAPLQPFTTYSVRLAGWIDHGDGRTAFTKAWSFTTAPWAAPVALRMQRRGNQVTLTGRSFAPQIQLFVDGIAVRVERTSATELQFPLPGGVGGRPADLLLVNPGGLEGRWLGLDFGGVSPGSSPLQTISLAVDGAVLAEGALVDQAGRLFLPESALQALGGKASRLEGLYRSDWQWLGRTGEYTRASLKATVGEGPYSLQTPPFWHNGQLWLEATFVTALSGAPLVVTTGQVTLGRPVPPPVLTGEFTDIQGHWAAEQIRALGQRGIISGYPDGSFRPEAGLSRAAFIKLLVQAMGLDLKPRDAGAFDDAVGHWVSELGYLGAARTAGILPDWRFTLEPDRLIARTEIAVMLTRALRLEVKAQRRAVEWGGVVPWLIGGRPFQDVADWSYRGHVAMAIESGIIAGYAEPDGTFSFRPERAATRAEAAVMVTRFQQKRPVLR